jgi:hypothetical protein
MSALSADERARHTAVTRELFSAIRAVRELPDGHAFDLPDHPGRIGQAAEFEGVIPTPPPDA